MTSYLNNLSIWKKHWSRICQTGNGKNFRDELIIRYSEPHRSYHNTQHLQECLDLFKEVENSTQSSSEIFLAIWYHDAIYNIQESDNEEQSAKLARKHLLSAHSPVEKVQKIEKLILATKHSSNPTDFDEQLLVDIDLAILASHPERFHEYELQIRYEYKSVPQLLFSSKRREILSKFLNRPQIFNTAYFFNKFEQQARKNLTEAITSLNQL